MHRNYFDYNSALKVQGLITTERSFFNDAIAFQISHLIAVKPSLPVHGFSFRHGKYFRKMNYTSAPEQAYKTPN